MSDLLSLPDRVDGEPSAVLSRNTKLRAYWGAPGRREAHGAVTRAAMADPAVRQRISERTAAAMRDPERKARHVTRIRATHSDPAFIEAQRARAVAQWSDPVVRRKHGELTRAKMAERVAAPAISDERGKSGIEMIFLSPQKVAG